MSILRSVSFALLLAGLSTAQAAEPQAPAAPSKEMRAQMAAAHEKMAGCLRSDKSIEDCRAEMRKSAPMHEGCEMMMKEHGQQRMGLGGPKPDDGTHAH